MSFSRKFLSALAIPLFLLVSSKVEAAWTIEGPIVVSKLSSIDVLINHTDASRIDVSLLDADENVLTRVSALERWATFSLIQPGTYYILVDTSGSSDLKVYVSVTPFKGIDTSL